MPINYYCDVEVQSNVLTTDVSNSRVGINEASPAETLHVNGAIRTGAASSSTYVKLSNDDINLYNTGSLRGSITIYPNSSSGSLYIYGANGSTVYFGAPTSYTTNIRVQGQATLTTINNATSDTDKFLVSDGGTIKYRTGAEVRADIGAGTGDGTVTGTGSSGRVAVWSGSSSLTSDSELYFDTTNNRLGIGVQSSPQSPLHVKSSATDDIVRVVGASGGKPQINIYEGNNNVGRIICTGNADFNFSNENSGAIGFFTGGSSRISIASGGNVGIGTTNPLDKLHVNGTARANDYSVNGVASMFVYSNQLVITNSGNPLYLGGGPGSVAMNVLIPNGNLNVTGTTTTDNLNIGQNGTIDAENSSEILIGSGTEIQIDGDPGTSGQYLKSTGSAVEWATLPDTTTTQTIITSNFLDGGSTTSALRIPFNNLVETSSNQYYNCMDMPAAGTVKRFRMHNTSGTMSTGFTTTMSIFKNGSTTPTSSGALTASSGQIEWEPSNYTFNKGDHLQFSYAKSAGSKYWQGVSASIIIEFTKV